MAYDEYYESGWRMEATTDRILLTHAVGGPLLSLEPDGTLVVYSNDGRVDIPAGIARALIESMFDRLMLANESSSHDPEPVAPEAGPATG